MKTKMQDTSLKAYDYLIKTHKIPPAEQAVLKALDELGEATDIQLSQRLKWPINRVTGRRNGLMKKGVIASHKSVSSNVNGRAVSRMVWKIV